MGNKNEARDIPISFDGDEDLEVNSEEVSDKLEEEEITDELEEVESESDKGDQPRSVEAAVEEVGAVEPGEPQQDQVAQRRAQINALIAEKASLYDRLLRGQAEFENYRKRVERERGELYQRGRDDVLLQFLPVVDNFERALSSLETSDGDAESMRHGVELIHKQFKDLLSKFGLEAVEAVGQVFDPHVHEAVTTEATDKHEENTVIEEFQRGYRIGDRLLRPSKVKVASTPEK
jgi:molecular chaperone GrpE